MPLAAHRSLGGLDGVVRCKPPLSFFARERPDGRVGFWWLASDSDAFTAAKTNLRLTFNHSTGLRFDGEAREWTLPLRSFARLQRWADAWSSDQHWEATSHDGRRNSHRTDDAGRAPRVRTASSGDPYEVLHLRPDAPLWAAEAVYRAAQKHMHPDVGGDHVQAVAVNLAIACIRQHAEALAS